MYDICGFIWKRYVSYQTLFNSLIVSGRHRMIVCIIRDWHHGLHVYSLKTDFFARHLIFHIAKKSVFLINIIVFYCMDFFEKVKMYIIRQIT